jgi:diguanylate cyclase (GGDEF)-like protein
MGFVLLVITIFADLEIHATASFSLFYLISVLAVAWGGGPLPGLLMAAFVAFVERFYMHRNTTSSGILFWNTLLRFFSFTVVIYMMALLREFIENERKSSRSDFLTGLLNSRGFYERSEIELQRAKRYGGRLALAYIDCDNFKTINDTFGHETGDNVLRLVGETMNLSTRSTDLACRLGGDEFAILLTDASENDSEDVLKKLLERLLTAMKVNNWPVTFSIGGVFFPKPPDTVESMIKAGDELMYEIKKSEKNRIEFRTLQNN